MSGKVGMVVDQGTVAQLSGSIKGLFVVPSLGFKMKPVSMIVSSSSGLFSYITDVFKRWRTGAFLFWKLLKCNNLSILRINTHPILFSFLPFSSFLSSKSTLRVSPKVIIAETGIKQSTFLQ